MTEQKFKLSSLAYLVIGIAWVISVWATVFILKPSLGELNLTRDLLPILLLIIALISPSVILTWSLIVEKTTSLSTDGISRLTLSGRKHIAWREIKSIQTGIFYINIKLAQTEHHIPLLMYSKANDLAKHIREQYARASNSSHLN